MSNRGCCVDNEAICVRGYNQDCHSCQYDVAAGNQCNEANLVVNESVTVVMFWHDVDIEGTPYNETTFDVYIGPQKEQTMTAGARDASYPNYIPSRPTGNNDIVPDQHPNSFFKNELTTAIKIGETPPVRDVSSCNAGKRRGRCITPMYYTYASGLIRYTRIDVWWYLRYGNWDFLESTTRNVVGGTGFIDSDTYYAGQVNEANIPRFITYFVDGYGERPGQIYPYYGSYTDSGSSAAGNYAATAGMWLINKAEKTATADLKYLRELYAGTDANYDIPVPAFYDTESVAGSAEGYVVLVCFPSACEAIGGEFLEPIEEEVYSSSLPDIRGSKDNAIAPFYTDLFGEISYDYFTGMPLDDTSINAASVADNYNAYARSVVTPASNLTPPTAIVTNAKAFALKNKQTDWPYSLDLNNDGVVTEDEENEIGLGSRFNQYVPRSSLIDIGNGDGVGCCYSSEDYCFDRSFAYFDPLIAGGAGGNNTVGEAVDNNPNDLPEYTPPVGVCAPEFYEGHPGRVSCQELPQYQVYRCRSSGGEVVNCGELADGVTAEDFSINGITYSQPRWHRGDVFFTQQDAYTGYLSLCWQGPEYTIESRFLPDWNSNYCRATCFKTTSHIIVGITGKFYAHPTLSSTLNPNSSSDYAEKRLKVSTVILATSPSVIEKFKEAIANYGPVDCDDGPCGANFLSRSLSLGYTSNPYLVLYGRSWGFLPDISEEVNYALDNNNIIYFDKQYVQDYLLDFCQNPEIDSYPIPTVWYLLPPPEFDIPWSEPGYMYPNDMLAVLEGDKTLYMPSPQQTTGDFLSYARTGERYNMVNFFFDSKGLPWNGDAGSIRLELFPNDPLNSNRDIASGSNIGYITSDHPAYGKSEFFRYRRGAGEFFRGVSSSLKDYIYDFDDPSYNYRTKDGYFLYNPSTYFGYTVSSAADELYGSIPSAYWGWMAKNVVGSFLTLSEAKVCDARDFNFCCRIVYNPDYEEERSSFSRHKPGWDQFISRDAPTHKGNGIIQLFINGANRGNAFDMINYPGVDASPSNIENVERFSDKYSIDPRSVNKVYSIYTRYTEQTPEYLDPDVFSVTEVLSGANDNCDGSEPLKFLWGNPLNYSGLDAYYTDPNQLDELKIYSQDPVNHLSLGEAASVAVDHQTNLRARNPVASRDNVTLSGGLPYNYDLSAIERQIQTCGINQTGISVDRRPAIRLYDLIYAQEAGYYIEGLRESPDLSSNTQRYVCTASGFSFTSYNLVAEGCVPYYEVGLTNPDNSCTGYITLKSDWSTGHGSKRMFRLQAPLRPNDLTLFKYFPETYPLETCTSFDENKPRECAARYYLVSTKCCSDDLPCPEQVYMQDINNGYIFSAQYQLGYYGSRPFPCMLDTPMNYRDFYRTKVIGQPYAAHAADPFSDPHCVTIVDKKDKTTSAYIPEIWAKEKAVNLNAALFEMDFKNALKTTNLDGEIVYIIPSNISVAGGLGLGINTPNYFSWDEHDSDYGELVQRTSNCDSSENSTCSYGLWNFSDGDNFSSWSNRPEIRLKVKDDSVYYAIAYIMPRYSEVAASVGKSIDVFGTSIHNVSKPILGPRSGCNDNGSLSSIPESDMCAEDEELRYKTNGHGDFGAGWEHFRTQAFFEKLGETPFPTHTADTFNYDVMFFSSVVKCQNWAGTMEIVRQINRHSSYVAARNNNVASATTYVSGNCENGPAGIDHIFHKVAEIKAKITPRGPKSYASRLSFVDRDPMDNSLLEEGGHAEPKVIIEEGIAGVNKNTIIPAESSAGAPYRATSRLAFAYYPTMNQAASSMNPCDERYRKYVIDSISESTPITRDQGLAGQVQGMFGYFSGSNMADITLNEYKYNINE